MLRIADLKLPLPSGDEALAVVLVPARKPPKFRPVSHLRERRRIEVSRFCCF